MGWIDAITSGSFLRTGDEAWAFYPWGVLGRGYRLRDASQYRRFRAGVVIAALGTVGLCFALWLARGPGPALAALALLLALYALWVAVVVRRLPPAAERLRMEDVRRGQADARSSRAAGAELALSAAAAAFALLLYARLEQAPALGAAGFFALTGLWSLWVLLRGRRSAGSRNGQGR